MSRDLKPKKAPPPVGKSGGGTLVGMFIGLVLGVVIAAGVVFYMNKAPLPFVNKLPTPAPTPVGTPAKEGAPAEKAPAAKPAEPLALPGKPGDPVPEKRFQFYDILPGKADAVPDKPGAKPAEKPADKAEAKAEKDEGKDSKTPLFLQAGSFSKAQDADSLKANLALIGIEALVQQVMVQDRTFYRVRVGPFSRADEMNKIRTEMAKNGIDAQPAKNKE